MILSPANDNGLRVFLATIYGEAAQSSEAAWKAIASVIMNRVGVREWSRWKTPLDIIRETGFDAFDHRNSPYITAWKALQTPYIASLLPAMGRLIAACQPIYEGGARTTDAQLYYSPKAQAALHKKNPRVWPAVPRWKFELLEAVDVPGTEKDDFAFFRYRKVVA
jgi:hypothetical protein